MIEEVLSRIKLLHQLQVIRYGLGAVAATLTDLVLYFLLYNYWLHDFVWHVPFLKIPITHQLASISISYSTGTVVNFLISKYFVFHESTGRGRDQFIRFLIGATMVFFANYLLLWLFNATLPLFLPWGEAPLSVIARGSAAVCGGVISFLFHKLYTFK
jgi:putative flippase GtrA